jgi:hypothetical protein
MANQNSFFVVLMKALQVSSVFHFYFINIWNKFPSSFWHQKILKRTLHFIKCIKNLFFFFSWMCYFNER